MTCAFVGERVTGIEPAFSAWEADVLPLNYTREVLLTLAKPQVRGPFAFLCLRPAEARDLGVTLA